MVHDRNMSLYDEDSALILVMGLMATDIPGIRTFISGTCLLILPLVGGRGRDRARADHWQLSP
jgi:hypothetical protein